MIFNANALYVPLVDGCVQTVVTSPPYWSLRDYGVTNQLGLERVPDCLGWANGHPCGECYVCQMVAVFREVRRVLRDDGVLWLNLGDSFSDKQLLGIPWRTALALQADGWYLRSDIIWHKPNPMPESVTDRPTRAHEYVFLLSKSQHYYFDQEAVREKSEQNRWGGHENNSIDVSKGDYRGLNRKREMMPPTRNIRTVWTIPTQPTPYAHFATFPEKLVEPCILAGTSERGCCPKCGKAWGRVVEKVVVGYSESPRSNGNKDRNDAQDGRTERVSNTTGWQPSCECDAGDPVPCVVFDPFAGSGTVERVAIRLRRRSVGGDLNFKYIAEIASRRTTDIQVKLI